MTRDGLETIAWSRTSNKFQTTKLKRIQAALQEATASFLLIGLVMIYKQRL